MSCRLCKAKSHIPLTCNEFKKENGISERRVIEEARTEALIRTCGKCKVRILKEDGCNKVICTKCYAVLCDYCGKDISKQMYNHFDGQGRAPPGVNTDDKTGKCPLYDESHKRKDQQVDKAEKEAMAKVRAEHPDLSEEDLKIKFAQGIQSPSNQLPVIHRHHVDVPPHHNHHHRHHRQGMRGAAMAAILNREPVRALDRMFDDVNYLLDGLGGDAPHGVRETREQGRQAREEARIAHQQAHQQQMQREALLRQQEAAFLAHQQTINLQQVALRRLDHARRAAAPNPPAQTPNARMTTMNNAVVSPFANGPQVADVWSPRHNDQAFGNNAKALNGGSPDDGRAKRGTNEFRRMVEERLHGLGGMRSLDPPAQPRTGIKWRRRAPDTDRTAPLSSEGRSYVDPFDLERPPRMPGEFPQAPERRTPVAPGAFSPWVPGANDQAYL